jgi:hypothetical protein
MTTPEALLADLRARGIELETDGERLRWRPTFLVSEPLAAKLLAHRPELVALLQTDRGRAGLSCPLCGRPLDSARRCPRCFDRLCEGCGRPTGSYFIRLCVPCGHADQPRENTPCPIENV